MNEFTKNAKFAFVIAEKPKFDELMMMEPDKKWGEFLFNIRSHARPSLGIQKIHENVWLIPLEDELMFLNGLIQYADGSRIPLRILFLDAEPEWIKHPRDVG